jgi:hypothetical protein
MESEKYSFVNTKMELEKFSFWVGLGGGKAPFKHTLNERPLRDFFRFCCKKNGEDVYNNGYNLHR